MKKFIGILSFLVLFSVANAQEKVVLDNVSYTIFLPEKPNGMAILCCPGGGYETVCDEHEGKGWAEEINKMGIAWIVVNYQLPNGNPKIPFASIETAMKHIQANAEKYHINSNQIGIAGFSAGGHLAATYSCYASKNVRPAFQVLFYPVITMDSTFTHVGSLHHLLGEKPSKSAVKKYSLEKQTNKNMPATIVFVSNDDSVVPKNNSLFYVENATKKAKNRKDIGLIVYPSGNHGWGNSKDFMYHNDVITNIQNFLESWQFEHSVKTKE